MKTQRPHFAARALSGVLAFLVGFGPLSPLAFAATTPLADGPINVNNQAKPNVLFTIDDSTSMHLDFLPDYLVMDSGTNAATSYCRGATGLANCGSVGSATIPQYVYADWGMPTGIGTVSCPSGACTGVNGPPAVMTSAFNSMWYNPTVTYTAPLKYDGTSYPDMTKSATSNWTQVPADPYLFPTSKYVNLQTKVAVGVWCNTTYGGTMADKNGLTIGGDFCRINGFAYPVSTTSGNSAPKTLGDYNYPFAKVATDSDNSKYFATTTRAIYCDPNKMNGTWYDAPSGTNFGSNSTAPSCVSCALGCPVSQVEDPTSPAGCDVGCLNPAECTKCNLKCPVAQVYTGCTPATCAAIADKVCAEGTRTGQASKTCDTLAGKKCQAGSAATCNTTSDPPNTFTPAASPACSTVITGVNKTNTVLPGSTIGKSYEQDANANGDVCRRNNFAGYGAGGWTYPSGAFTTAVTSGCGTITASINRHYYKSTVQWCDTQIPTSGNDKWRGFGKGTCQAEKTAVYKFPRFFKFGAYADSAFATLQDNYGDNTAFELIEVDYKNEKIIVANGTPGTTIDHTFLRDGESVTVSRNVSGTTPATSELVNYANWFAYYRTRILAAKTVTSLAFSELTDKFRVGFHTLANPASSFLTIKEFTGGGTGHRKDWFAKLAAVSIPMGNDTPLIDGVVRIGEWFKATDGKSAALSGSTDPIALSCQKNFHMMFTDGYTNQAKPTSFMTDPNQDTGKIGKLPEFVVSMPETSDWPKRFAENPALPVDDSLADYAMYYWRNDLRPAASFAKNLADNNVPARDTDPATWQHLNFAALSLGTEGTISSRNVDATEKAIEGGSVLWPTPSPTYRPGPKGVDDLWHAAVNGHGLFVNARDPQELQAGMVRILKEADNLQASRTGAAFSSVAFSATDNYIYRVTIEPGWGGTLTKVEVDPLGEAGEIKEVMLYHKALADQVTPASAGDKPWDDKRKVVTWNNDSSVNKAVPFKLAQLSASQQSSLGSTSTVQQRVVDYLRGDKSNEGTSLSRFRVRTQILGDIVNSSPVVVGVAKGQYSNSTDPGYETFKDTTKLRKKMVYVGSNDGMLHAFDEDKGTELFAYIPSFAYSSVADKGLAMLTKKDPFFKHQMFVDSTPVAADVKVGSDWKTYLIGGLGKGGKGYYAIDITDPSTIKTEDDAAKAVKWEFTDSDMGYSYGKPLIAKTYADGWVAIFPSGYDASGKAKLYVVNIGTGALIRKLETTATGDAGLAQVSGFVLSYKNQYLEQIYGGDLNGDVWRFDVSNSDATKWTVDKFAELRIDSKAQSVTTAPQIEVDVANGVDRYVMIGTGRLLHEDDLATYKDQIQTMYAIRDGTVLKPLSSGLPFKPRGDADFSVGDATTTAGFSGLSVKGWYMDLPKGERIITPIAAELGLVGWAGSKPPDNECLAGLKASLYVRKFTNTESIIEEGGAVVASINVDEGAVGMEFINVYSATPNDPTLKLAITLGTNGKTIYVDLAKAAFLGDHRMSWRLMGQ